MSRDKKDLREERKKHRREENRLSILRAGEEVFARKGYSLTTMDDIAREAQFSKATLYSYFRSKNEIFFEIILNSHEEVILKLKKIKDKEESVDEKIKRIIRFILKSLRQKENISRIFLMEKSLLKNVLGVMPPDGHSLEETERRFLQEIQRKRKAMLEIISEIFHQGIVSGEFRDIDSLEAAYILESMVRGFHFTRFWRERSYSLNKSTHLIHQFFLYGLKKGLRASQGEKK
ncbi:TetR/AcrR family transcriptional regulator [bacterium]|nr:TetR/AcrR family transcriptional regulator [bacterium]